jgi:2-keto-3-deoxy-6-phosphogluconate aldolase
MVTSLSLPLLFPALSDWSFPTLMTRKEQALGRILQAGLLPNLIKDNLDPERAVEAAVAEGARAFEVSCRRPDTIALLKRLRTSFPDVSFGVSSLIEDGSYFRFLQQRGPRFPSIAEAVEAGAEFLVSFIAFSAETYRQFEQVAIIPGVTTPDEAKRQLDLGASLVKFSNLTVEQVRTLNVAPIHSGLPLLVTGGVRVAQVRDFVAAGVLVAVCGFDLICGGRYVALQRAFDPAEVGEYVKRYVEAFAEARRTFRPDVDFASGDPRIIQRQSGQFMNVA